MAHTYCRGRAGHPHGPTKPWGKFWQRGFSDYFLLGKFFGGESCLHTTRSGGSLACTPLEALAVEAMYTVCCYGGLYACERAGVVVRQVDVTLYLNQSQQSRIKVFRNTIDFCALECVL